MPKCLKKIKYFRGVEYAVIYENILKCERLISKKLISLGDSYFMAWELKDTTEVSILLIFPGVDENTELVQYSMLWQMRGSDKQSSVLFH